eukprot:424424-Prorocentrum_lima.AAC.1
MGVERGGPPASLHTSVGVCTQGPHTRLLLIALLRCPRCRLLESSGSLRVLVSGRRQLRLERAKEPRVLTHAL